VTEQVPAKELQHGRRETITSSSYLTVGY